MEALQNVNFIGMNELSVVVLCVQLLAFAIIRIFPKCKIFGDMRIIASSFNFQESSPNQKTNDPPQKSS